MATYPRTQTPQDDDPLSYQKAPSLSFKDAPIGTTYKGIITQRAQLVQSRDFETQEPAVWPDGNPKMSVVIQLEVDGEARSLWAPKPSGMFAALVAAQKEAGAGTMQEGGTLWVKFTGTQPNAKNPRLNEAKIYACKYLPPKQVDPFEDSDAATTATPAARPPTPAVRPATPAAHTPRF